MKHKVYVTRDASVTYVTEVEGLTLEEIEARCGKHGFDDSGLPDLIWDEHNLSTYDNAEAYEITHDEERVIDGDSVMDEITDKQWDLS